MRPRKTTFENNQLRIFSELGQNIRLARIHRKLSLREVAEKANISRPTLWRIEKGSATVSIGSYLDVLFVFGLERDLTKIASTDWMKYEGGSSPEIIPEIKGKRSRVRR